MVVILHASKDLPTPRGLLTVYHAVTTGYTLTYRFEGAGTVALLRTGDLNADGKSDIVWTDTSCGAHTCVSTLFVVSWDGKAARLHRGRPDDGRHAVHLQGHRHGRERRRDSRLWRTHRFGWRWPSGAP